MRRRVKVAAIVLVSASLLAACSRFSMLAQPLEGPAAVEVRSVSEGQVLQPDDSVTFLIRAEQQEPYSLEIELADPSDRSIWQTTLDAPPLNEELELKLPALSLGQYRLRFRVIGDSGAVNEKTVTFFYAPGEYQVLGIRSFPPSLLPGTSMVLKADLKVPAGSDPFLRWTLADAVVASGTLRRGLDEITCAAPATEGIYTVRLELFPVAPPDRTDYSFSSTNRLDAQVFVSSRRDLSEGDLVPGERYFRLFHFNGDLQDSAPRAQPGTPPSATVIGDPQLVAVQDTVGYRLDPAEGLNLPEWLLPVGRPIPDPGRPESDVLRPFTLTMGWVLDPPTGTEKGGRELLRLRSREGNFLLSVEADSSELVLLLQSGEDTVHVPSGFQAPADGREHFFSFSLVPGTDAVDVQWFLDGVQTSARTAPFPQVGLSGTGEGRIGGSPALSGTITELGVYYRDEQGRPATDARLYERAMERRYHQALIAADGFDGQYLTGEAAVSGPVSVRQGALVVGGSGSLELSGFEAGSDGFSLDVLLGAGAPPTARIGLYEEGGTRPLLEVEASGRLRYGNREEALPGYPARETVRGLRLEAAPLETDPRVLAVTLTAGSSKKELRLEPSAGAASPLRVRLENVPERAPQLSVERILLLHGRE